MPVISVSIGESAREAMRAITGQTARMHGFGAYIEACIRENERAWRRAVALLSPRWSIEAAEALLARLGRYVDTTDAVTPDVVKREASVLWHGVDLSGEECRAFETLARERWARKNAQLSTSKLAVVWTDMVAVRAAVAHQEDT